MTVRFTTVLSSELAAVKTWAPEEFLALEGRACHLCGLTPGDTDRRPRKRGDDRPNPSTTLLEMAGPHPLDPLQRSRYQCRDRRGCEIRQRIVRARLEETEPEAAQA